MLISMQFSKRLKPILLILVVIAVIIYWWQGGEINPIDLVDDSSTVLVQNPLASGKTARPEPATEDSEKAGTFSETATTEKETVTAADLSGRPMATLLEDHPNFIQTKAAFAEMDAVFDPRFEAQYFIPLLTYVERGLAYAIADPIAAKSYALYKGAAAAIVFRPFLPVVHLVTSVMVPKHKPPSNLARSPLSPHAVPIAVRR